MHSRYKHIIVVITIFLCGILTHAAGLKVKGRFEVKEGELSGSIVTIERNGQSVKSFQPSRGKNDLGLDFGYNYTISFSKPGYVSKSIVFMTTVPDDIKDKGSFQYEFTLEIFKQVDGVNTMVYNQPVAKIYYSRETDNFADDKNYSATIQAQMAKVDAEIEKKKTEPMVNNKPAEVLKSENTLSSTNTNSQTSIQTSSNTTNTETTKKKEDTQPSNINKDIKKNENKKEEEDKAKIEAQQRKLLQEREENRRRTQKLAEEEATRESQQTQINLEKQKKAFRAEREAEEKKRARGKNAC